MFLKEIFPESFQGGVFTAVVKEYIASWLQTMYLNKMESIIARETGAPRGAYSLSLRGSRSGTAARGPFFAFAVSEEKTSFLLLTARLFLRKILFQNAPIDFPASARFP